MYETRRKSQWNDLEVDWGKVSGDRSSKIGILELVSRWECLGWDLRVIVEAMHYVLHAFMCQSGKGNYQIPSKLPHGFIPTA